MSKPRHLMVVPSLACPAACAYCFGPHEGGPPMRRETVEAVVAWQKALGCDSPLEITFHGGEPLVPGADFYRMALPILHDGLAPRSVRFAIQSNLWLLTPDLCDLFQAYRVSIGTSLDGPEPINDAQRGKGYFKRTLAGIELARSRGLDAGCICTFTARTAPYAQEILDFFIHEGLSFSIHAALPSLRHAKAEGWSLSPETHGQLLADMLGRYLANMDKVRISTLDAMCRSVSAGHGGICTFGDCLGGYLAVGPDGEIYPCQRFAGMPEFQMGNVLARPSWEILAETPIWRTFQERQERVRAECGECAHFGICRGGCPYNALVAGGGSFDGTLRDPHCPAYRQAFSLIVDRALAEVFSDENMEAVVSQPDGKAGLLRRGKLLSLMREGPHPSETAANARQILAAVALAATRDPAEAARRFERLGLTTNVPRTERGMQSLYRRLTTPSTALNNLYLHVTFACPLRCTHCYAQGGEARAGALAVGDVQRACREAAGLGFRHAVITGGEPLAHPRRDALLDALAGLRGEVKPLLTVLRTSLALPMEPALLRRVAHSTDEVVVSVDGDRETHDARRGAGSYDLTVSNLRAMVEMGLSTDLSLAAVLPLEQAHGAPGEAVRALAKELGIRRTRFRPLLPLGRAVDFELDIVPETLWGHLDPRRMVEYGFSPVASCGIGQNLYVEPDGAAYPCYAWHGEGWRLGRIYDAAGLAGVIGTPAFQELRGHTVNSNRACRECALRYLCGGACRAWSRQPAEMQTDLDAAPRDCTHLRRRATSLLESALARLEITGERWAAAGLPRADA
jgi:uncharacterized protein